MSELRAPHRRIRARPSEHDPTIMRFVLDDALTRGADIALRPADAAERPLAAALFAIDGVAQAHVSGATVQVRRSPGADWGRLKHPVAQAIREVLDRSDCPLGSAQRAAEPDRLCLVQDLLDRHANPAIAAHGGRVSVERVEGARVFLRFAGGCQGCAASSRTLRDGIESILRGRLSWLGDIVDVTDHAAGTDPYYSRANGAPPRLARPVPPDVMDMREGEVRIDPGFLAQRLGLTRDGVVAGMASGEIQRQVETRSGVDGSVTQVTISTPRRAWSADFHANGQAFEVPPPRIAAGGVSRGDGAG